VKALDFADFKRASDIMQTKGHLTESGLEEIRRAPLPPPTSKKWGGEEKEGMNTGRKS